MTRFRAQVKRIFDESKITVVGSPTITSDGVASGFSGGNCIKKDGILPTSGIHDYVFKLRYKHNTNDFTTTGYMFNVVTTGGVYFGAVARLSPKTISFVESISGGPYFVNTVSLVEGQTYDIEMQTDFSTYARYYIDGELKGSVTYAKSHSPTTGNVIIGAQAPNIMPVTMGELDLKQFKIYVDGELVYSPTRPKTFLEKRKLKKKWFTIIGNPTITANKLASGFSNKNYIETFNSFLLANPFELYFGFTATNVNDRQTIFGMQTGYGFNIALQSGKMMFGASSSGASLDIAGNLTSSLTINANTKYLGRLKWTGTVYTLSLYINNAWVDYITVNNSNAILAGKTVNVGLVNNAYPYVNGSIDLKDIKLVVNSIPVFDGSVDTYEYDPSKFTIVGSPTITEYGVASFPIADDYVDTQLSSNVSSTWKIKTKFTTGTALDAIRTIFHNYLPGNLSNRSEVFLNYNKLGASITVDNDKYIATTATGSITVTTNTTYWASLSFDGASYTFEYSTDGITWKQIWNVSSTANVLQQKTRVGNNAPVDRRFNGSIDLPSISITVDGKEVFTGAKEQYYAMRGM